MLHCRAHRNVFSSAPLPNVFKHFNTHSAFEGLLSPPQSTCTASCSGRRASFRQWRTRLIWICRLKRHPQHLYRSSKGLLRFRLSTIHQADPFSGNEYIKSVCCQTCPHLLPAATMSIKRPKWKCLIRNSSFQNPVFWCVCSQAWNNSSWRNFQVTNWETHCYITCCFPCLSVSFVENFEKFNKYIHIFSFVFLLVCCLDMQALKCHNSDPASPADFQTDVGPPLLLFTQEWGKNASSHHKYAKGCEFDLHASAVPEQMTRRNTAAEEIQVRGRVAPLFFLPTGYSSPGKGKKDHPLVPSFTQRSRTKPAETRERLVACEVASFRALSHPCQQIVFCLVGLYLFIFFTFLLPWWNQTCIKSFPILQLL